MGKTGYIPTGGWAGETGYIPTWTIAQKTRGNLLYLRPAGIRTSIRICQTQRRTVLAHMWPYGATRVGNVFVRASRCRNRKHIRSREPLPKQKLIRFREQIPKSETFLFARTGSETGNVSVRAKRCRNRKRIRSREPVPKSEAHQTHILISLSMYIYTYIYICTKRKRCYIICIYM